MPTSYRAHEAGLTTQYCEMPVRHLTLLTEEVALVLAQPVMGDWDGQALLPIAE